jgi:predicted  nucleic acid-binding Zn-ribbon protein
MTDLEYRIKIAERELAHLRELYDIQQSHIGAHDASLHAIDQRFERIEADLATAAANLKEVSAGLKEVSSGLKNLIDIITREHRNGKS